MLHLSILRAGLMHWSPEQQSWKRQDKETTSVSASLADLTFIPMQMSLLLQTHSA